MSFSTQTAVQHKIKTIQCILGYPNLDYPDPPLSEQAIRSITSLKNVSTHAQRTYCRDCGRFSLCALFVRLRTNRGYEFYRGYDKVKTQEKCFKYNK